MSAVSMTSFTPTGIPCSGPRDGSAIARARLRERLLRVQVRPRRDLVVARLDPLEARPDQLLGAPSPGHAAAEYGPAAVGDDDSLN